MSIGILKKENVTTLRDPKSFKHAYEINKPFGIIEEILSWCKDELVSEWKWQLVDLSSHKLPGRYIFYFDNDRDYLAFLIKWS